MFGYNEVISHMERSLEVWQIPPSTPCVCVCVCVCVCYLYFNPL